MSKKTNYENGFKAKGALKAFKFRIQTASSSRWENLITNGKTFQE